MLTLLASSSGLQLGHGRGADVPRNVAATPSETTSNEKTKKPHNFKFDFAYPFTNASPVKKIESSNPQNLLPFGMDIL